MKTLSALFPIPCSVPISAVCGVAGRSQYRPVAAMLHDPVESTHAGRRNGASRAVRRSCLAGSVFPCSSRQSARARRFGCSAVKNARRSGRHSSAVRRAGSDSDRPSRQDVVISCPGAWQGGGGVAGASRLQVTGTTLWLRLSGQGEYRRPARQPVHCFSCKIAAFTQDR